MSDIELSKVVSALREAVEKATPGPWTATIGDGNDLHFGRMTFTSLYAGDHNVFSVAGMPFEDAEFMALARNALPVLLNALATVERLANAWEEGSKAGYHITQYGDLFADELREALRFCGTETDEKPA